MLRAEATEFNLLSLTHEFNLRSLTRRLKVNPLRRLGGYVGQYVSDREGERVSD